jgi:cell division protein FtsL
MELVKIILLTFFILILAMLAIRVVGKKLRKMQRQRKSSKFDNKFSKHWKRGH